MNTDTRTIVITGGAGYVGEMLCDQFAKRADVARIIAIDKEPQSEYSKSLPKVEYIQANLAETGWEEQVRAASPDTIIHTAWQIRALYGDAATQWNWNVGGSDRVFALAFSLSSVSKLIYFSTASSYAAYPDNSLDHYFTEAEGFRPDMYIYAHEKYVVEENLRRAFHEAKEKGGHSPQVTVVRPAAITGPRGRFMRLRFGLQSALSGNLKGNFVYRLVTLLTSFVPATKGWVRQFIHEDDVTDIVAAVTFGTYAWDYEVFNITPVGEPVYAEDMARAVGKRILPIQPWMASLAFSLFWHGTRGRVPTCPGSWRFYSYPILMSGEKLRSIYECQYTSKDAFAFTSGRYEAFVPEDKKNPRPV